MTNIFDIFSYSEEKEHCFMTSPAIAHHITTNAEHHGFECEVEHYHRAQKPICSKITLKRYKTEGMNV